MAKRDKAAVAAPTKAAKKAAKKVAAAKKTKAPAGKRDAGHEPHPVFGTLEVNDAGVLCLRTADGTLYPLELLASEPGAELTLKLKLSESALNVRSLSARHLQVLVLLQEFLVDHNLGKIDTGATCCHKKPN